MAVTELIRSYKRITLILLILLMHGLFASSIAIATELELKEPGFTLELPDSWDATRHPSNTFLRKNQGTFDAGADGVAEQPQMNITTENRLDHADALQRLLDIGGVRGATWKFLEIDGWPALQQRYLRDRPQPNASQIEGSEMILVVETVVAAGDLLIRMNTWLRPDASAAEISEIESIGSSLTTPVPGSASETARELDGLRRNQVPESALPPVGPSVAAPLFEVSTSRSPSPNLVSLNNVGDVEAGFSVPVSSQNGRDSELEIAVSPDGRDIVIGSNSFWYFSSDGGTTWNLSVLGGGNINGNDPAVAWGQSGGAQGTFYGANIASPSTGMITSTDGGANWQNAPAVYTCGQNGDAACSAAFPDQEHIATDRLNLTAGGDQVYSAWRHLDGNYGIVCSQDSAQNWSANAFFRTGDLPKPGVGADGFVYVIYLDSGNIMMDKFASCETQTNPMTPEPGFPRVVRANAAPVACPTPGLDRCNRRNTLSGITVAVDDTDSNHVYVTYAINTFANAANAFFEGSPVCTDQNLCNENIVVQDSLDGGFSWPAARRVNLNSGVTARRFMPWLCTIGGTAQVSWYDRRAAFPGGGVESNNSLTDFYAGSASLNVLGDLQSDGEYQINDPNTEDAQCEAGALTGTTGSWPSAVDRGFDSESCSVQPQLGGFCQDPGQNRCDFSDCGGVGMNNGSPACSCTAGFTCDINRGSPKYGDYNGNACAAGRLFMTWASAQAPLSAPAATDIDSVFSSEVVCCVPQIQVPGEVSFGDACGLDEQLETLNVCNTGKENLVVNSITGDGQFSVNDPLTNYPVTISPDFCFPFQASFNPIDVGSDSGLLTINSNDPLNPALEVPVSGSVGVAEIDIFIADSGDFGEVCSGLFHDMNLTIQSNGSCPLEIDSISISGADMLDFELPGGSFGGTVIEPGNSLQVPVRFAPDNFTNPSPRVANVAVESKTQGDGSLLTQQTSIEGTVPAPDLQAVIANSGDFGAVCKNELSDMDVTLFNQGRCDLTIDSISSDNGAFVLPSDTDFPLVLSHDAEFTLPVRFAPTSCDDNGVTGEISIDHDSPSDTDPTVINVGGVAPCPNLVIDPGAFSGDFAFPATVVDSEELLGCYSDRSTNLRNTGDCPLTITDIQATGLDFTVMQPTSFPIVLPPGEETLGVTVRFTPTSGGDPLAPDETTGTLAVTADDGASGDAELCGEGVVQSGIRTLVTDITIGFPEIIDSVDSMTVRTKGKKTPSPINLQFTDVEPADATICGNTINYHLNLEILPATQTTGKNGKSQYEVFAKEGNLQDARTFGLDQCEFSEFEMQLKSSDGGGACLLLQKGEACSNAAECCSGKCKGKNGAQTCR